MDNKENSPEKLDLKSMDIVSENRNKLRNLFPGVFTETKNEKGVIVESVDFEKLKAEIGEFSDLFEKRRERYGMDCPGKKDCLKLIQQFFYKLYLVGETKGTLDSEKRREIENNKIEYGKAHFEAIGVSFRVANTFNKLITG